MKGGTGFTVINMTILMVGILFIIAGVRGQTPMDVLREALGKSPKSSFGGQGKTGGGGGGGGGGSW